MKSSYKFILTLVVGLTVILGIMMTAFSLPAVNSGVHNVPIGVVTEDKATYDKLAKPLEDKGFKVTHYKHNNSMKDDVTDRKIYGAIALSKTGDVTIYEASAASTAVAQALTQIGQGMVTQQKAAAKAQIAPMMEKAQDVQTIKMMQAKLNAIDAKQAKIVDLKSFPKADPKGAGLAAGALPIALGGWIGAVAIANMVKGKREKLAAILAFAVIGGLGLVAVIQFVVGTFDGNYFITSLCAMLGIAATGFFVLGLLEVIGNAGLGIAAVMLILLGNPLSGLSSAPEMLPSGWGAFGQLLPPGATGTLLRNIVFFDGHATAMPITVLAAYVIIGGGLYYFGKRSKI
ncbi:ABC transporter permease [Eupransor demetentiae]|uniref:Phage infection protein (PIP) family (YhgE) n=1 Tax=Eupransor demetentiae TaxID=3109584 RepID=A0ABP0EQP5_9LACO|nr:Uncharacterized membrane protein YhgE [Lactobacillaceae bacterium LMG 33000]